MKLIDMTCPHCGAKLKVDADNNHAACEFCGTSLLVDNEVQHVHYDNAGDAGYEFEKGRQRAQTEAYATAHVQMQPQKRKTWLWVLGWICIFPVPLTILMSRNKKINKGLKIGIIIAAWVAYLLIALLGGNSDKTNEQKGETNTVSATSDVSTENDSVNEPEKLTYADDEVVNKFISAFNAHSQYRFSDISNGNIRTKYFGTVNECYIEMINATESTAGSFCVKINGGQKDSDQERMLEVFKDVVYVLDPSVSDDKIQEAIDYFCAKGVLVEEYTLGENIVITYVPIVEVSYGKTSCRVDISANYK